MKKLALFLIPIFLQGCVFTKGFTSLQPKNVAYYQQSEKLVEISDAAEYTIKSPVRRTINLDGSVVEEPVFRTTTVENPILDEDGNITEMVSTITTKEPVSFSLWVRHTGAKPPKTGYDVITDGLRAGLAGYLGGKALGVIDSVTEQVQRDPLVVEQQNFVESTPPMVVTQNPSESWKVDRG